MQRITDRRLGNQRLVGSDLESAQAVVAWFGAMQAQDYYGSLWALGMRVPGSTDADIERAFNAGEILRLHVMRPTWHFVAPQDIRWLVELTAPRVRALNAYMYRKTELDEATLTRSANVITGALAGGKQLTRTEIGAALAEAGIHADGMRLGYIVHHAELESLICSGGRKGKQFTYALVDERAPEAKSLPREEALGELTRRFFTAHAPAQVDDLAWWSGLTKADVRAGIESLGSALESEVIDGKTYWYAVDQPPMPTPSPAAWLLPTYDEYIIGYADRADLIDAPPEERSAALPRLIFDSMIVIDGRIVGSWRREMARSALRIDYSLIRPLTDVEMAAVQQTAAAYGAFFGQTAVGLNEVEVDDADERRSLTKFLLGGGDP